MNRLQEGNPNTIEYMDRLYEERQHKPERVLSWLFPHLKKVVDQLPKNPGILEMGCGYGRTIEEMKIWRPDAGLIGLDLSPVGMNIAAERYKNLSDVLFLADDILSPKMNVLKTENEFDMTCTFQVLEHVDDPTAVMQAMLRITKPGGYVVNSVPKPKSSLSRVKNHVWEIGQKDFNAAFGSKTKKIVEGKRIIIIYRKPE